MFLSQFKYNKVFLTYNVPKGAFREALKNWGFTQAEKGWFSFQPAGYVNISNSHRIRIVAKYGETFKEYVEVVEDIVSKMNGTMWEEKEWQPLTCEVIEF